MPAECSVCLEIFNSGERLPKILSCGHTLCASCVVDVVKDEKLPCPQCREVVDARHLATNFALLQALEEKRAEPDAGAVAEAAKDPPKDELFVLMEAFNVERHYAKLAGAGITNEQLGSAINNPDQLRRSGWTEAEITRFWPEVESRKSKPERKPKPEAEAERKAKAAEPEAVAIGCEYLSRDEEELLQATLKLPSSDSRRVDALQVYLQRLRSALSCHASILLVMDSFGGLSDERQCNCKYVILNPGLVSDVPRVTRQSTLPHLSGNSF